MRRKYAIKYGVDERVFLPRIAHLKPNITYRCDRGCPNCNKCTSLCPSSEKEDLDPKKFFDMLQECVNIGRLWTHITLTGGEPTMHDKFEDFIEIMAEYKKTCNPECTIETYTYHHPKYYEKIEKILKKYPELLVKDTKKDAPRIHRHAMYKAPIDDLKRFGPNHLYAGCNDGARMCGLGYDFQGFYCCPVAAGIDRVFKLGVAITSLSDLTVPNLIAQYRPLCALCGCYPRYKARGAERNIISSTWGKAIKKYNENKI